MVFTFVVVGDDNTGKSSFVNACAGRTVVDPSQHDHKVLEAATFKLGDKKKVKVFDAPGHQFGRKYYSADNEQGRGSGTHPDAAIVLFDQTNKKSFDGAREWVSIYQKRGHSLIVLVGNKSDCKGAVSKRDAQKYAERENLQYFEASAECDAGGVKELFLQVYSLCAQMG